MHACRPLLYACEVGRTNVETKLEEIALRQRLMNFVNDAECPTMESELDQEPFHTDQLHFAAVC
jgi:hypothetical protein